MVPKSNTFAHSSMRWPAMHAQDSQLSKAKSMWCHFLVVAGHRWNIMLALASQVSKASKLTHQS